MYIQIISLHIIFCPAGLFKILKMMLWKCCTQYASKFGKFTSSHRTGKGQFSFQSQRRAMLKNVPATVQLCSFHMLARLCSKSFKLGIRELPNVQAAFWRVRGTRDQLPTFVGSWWKLRSSRKTYTFTSLTTLKLLTVWITTNCGKFLKRWEYQST